MGGAEEYLGTVANAALIKALIETNATLLQIVKRLTEPQQVCVPSSLADEECKRLRAEIKRLTEGAS